MHRDRLILALGEQVAPGYAGVSGVWKVMLSFDILEAHILEVAY
jgi:hypothetical protein